MTWVLLLMLLLCPIMMLFMHKGHNHGKNTGEKHNHGQHNNSSELGRLDNYKVGELEGEIEFLKTQNELLQTEVNSLSHTNPHK